MAKRYASARPGGEAARAGGGCEGDGVTLDYDPGYGPLLDTTIRIATWNVWGRYGPWRERQPAIVDNLRRIDADVVCLQEAWQDDERSQPADLAAALGFDHVYAPAFEIHGGWSGNAVLSRWPIARHSVVDLPMEGGGARDTDAGEKRVALFAEVSGPRGLVQVFCTHLSWRADWGGVRQAQVAEVCRFVSSTRPRPFPAVLCGDLNAEPGSDEIRMLTGLAAVPVRGVLFRDAWTVGGDGSAGATITARNPYIAASLDPEMRIDYVLAGHPKLGGAGHVRAARVAGDLAVDGYWPSDHLAVVADLRY
jgi:endonuclease/exonuclease/phosphatase family metal-dependent hydrolase